MSSVIRRVMRPCICEIADGHCRSSSTLDIGFASNVGVISSVEACIREHRTIKGRIWVVMLKPPPSPVTASKAGIALSVARVAAEANGCTTLQTQIPRPSKCKCRCKMRHVPGRSLWRADWPRQVGAHACDFE